MSIECTGGPAAPGQYKARDKCSTALIGGRHKMYGVRYVEGIDLATGLSI